MPLPCDHLVDNRNTLSGAGVLVLAFAAMLALIPTVQDLNLTADEEAVMASREVNGMGDSLTRALLFISPRARVFLAPSFVVGARAGLLHSNRFTSQSFLLNGMAIGFASNVSLVSLAVLVFAATNQRNKDWWSVLKDTILTWLTLLLVLIFLVIISMILHHGVAAQLFSTSNPSCPPDFYLANAAALDSLVRRARYCSKCALRCKSNL